MQFFLANLYSERLSGAPLTTEQHATPSPATAPADEARLAGDLVGATR